MNRFGIPFLAILACFAIMSPSAASPVACSMEAKMCPDGSAVSRTGPNCEFAPCSTPASPGSGAEGGTGMAPWTPTDSNCEFEPCVTPGSDGQNGTVEGRIVLGPTGPVARPGEPNQRPVAGVISVISRDGKATDITSDEEGVFHADLPPGTYEIQLMKAAVPDTFAKPQSVTVEAGKTANIIVMIDTGIR